MSKGDEVAEFARDIAGVGPDNPVWVELSNEMCWDAVVSCAYKAGGLSRDEFTGLYRHITIDNYARYVSRTDPVVRNAADMRTVPPGAFLGFVDCSTNRLAHAMLCVGHGYAAGTKNKCIAEMGKPIGWEILDLAIKLPFVREDVGTVRGRQVVYCVRFHDKSWKLHYRANPYT
jgi:hypothetical protein